jgi:DUF1680 family protein
MAELTRRDLLALVGGGAMAATIGRTAPAAAAGLSRAAPFALGDVRLLDGPFREAQSRDLTYLLALEPDRMLHNFRANAGLEPKAPVYGGWESEEPWVNIRCQGHTLGHYLSAAALMHASTGDQRMKQRVDYIVSELAACQRAGRTGLVCGFPDGGAQLENAVAGRPFVGVPWYTMHKIFAGLRDAREHAGSAAALEALTALADWTASVTAPMTDAAFQHMLDTEHGGMNEVLADVSALTGDRKYLALARRFCHEALLSPMADGRDTLDGLHANTQIPKVVGFERLYALTADERYGRASRFFWRTVVDRRSYVTGGHGDGEHFFPVGEFRQRLSSAKTMETCCTHNMLRLTRQLFQASPSAAYADYYERALLNGILASQDPGTGMNTYFQATRPGYVRLFHTPERSFWCCTGTGIENHAKHGDSVYFHDSSGIWVNLFIASSVTWTGKGLTLTQRTEFPTRPATRLEIDAHRPVHAAIRVRRPGWCPGMALRLNGRPIAATPDDTGYVVLDRQWRSGDVVDIDLPMSPGAVALPGADDVVAFVYGPVVLAGRLGRDGLSPGNQIIVNERESGTMLNADVQVPTLAGDAGAVASRLTQDAADPLVFRTAGIGRPHDVELAPYYRMAHERYNLYWTVARG